MAPGRLNQMAQVIQTIGAGSQGGEGFEANIAARQMGVGPGDIRRVADDHVELPLVQRFKPVAGQ